MPETSRHTVIDDASSSLDTVLPTKPIGSAAGEVPVHCGELLLTGWAIKKDTVLVQAGGLNETTEATVNGRRVKPDAVYEVKRDINGWQPLTALVLPLNTLDVVGEAFPPGFEVPTRPGNPARYTFWCMLFPRMRGC